MITYQRGIRKVTTTKQQITVQSNEHFLVNCKRCKNNKKIIALIDYAGGYHTQMLTAASVFLPFTLLLTLASFYPHASLAF